MNTSLLSVQFQVSSEVNVILWSLCMGTSSTFCKRYQAGDTRIPLPRKSVWTPQKIVYCKVGLYTSLRTVAEFLYQKLCISFTNSATVGRLEQVQLCNRLIDQSADNITGLKCAKSVLS